MKVVEIYIDKVLIFKEKYEKIAKEYKLTKINNYNTFTIFKQLCIMNVLVLRFQFLKTLSKNFYFLGNSKNW